MPETTSHAPGAPSWAELATTNEAGALSFYSALFGWADDPREISPDWYYHMQMLDGLEAASIYRLSEEERNQNLPPRWNLYFTVTSADETVETIKQNGGTVVFGPMDVFEAGRMAFCQDPQGAFFAIWQANRHIGARVTGDPGAMCWAELMTSNLNDATEFYIKVLGIERGEVVENMQYAMLKAGGTEVCGTVEITADMPPIPPHWTVYFAVADVDASLVKAESLGATILVPAQDIVKEEGEPPVGRFAALADPQGAGFSILQDIPQT